MAKFTTFRDEITGYEIKKYTSGPLRSAKLYFSTENFSEDDRWFFFERTVPGGGKDGECGFYRAEEATGELERIADGSYAGLAMSREGNYGVLSKADRVYRYDVGDNRLTEIGVLPAGGQITGHLTVSKSGLIACSYQQKNKIFALVLLDPATGKSTVVHQSDYHLGHCQICPGDDDTIFYIHETGGDALQRTWMYHVSTGENLPYYVEHEGDWITHETWTASGSGMIFMRYPHSLMQGTKDGHAFREVAHTEQMFLHPGVTRDEAWFCADSLSYPDEFPDWKDALWLIRGATGARRALAYTGRPATGSDHLHPSFNRRGDRILFNYPDRETGIAQVCVMDLGQVDRP